MQPVATDDINNDTINRCFSLKTDAEVLQWNQFSNSEIHPFIIGLLSNFQQKPTRSVTITHAIRHVKHSILYIYIYI